MDAKEFLSKFGKDLEKMKTETGGMVGAFGALFGKTMAEGTLSVKQKELIALAIAVAKQCEPCIILHVKKCVDSGATREEILEACGVAVMMSGGPGYTHIPVAIDALDAIEDVS